LTRPLVVLPRAADKIALSRRENLGAVRRDGLTEDHHDVEVQDEAGRRLDKAKLGEGTPGCTS